MTTDDELIDAMLVAMYDDGCPGAVDSMRAVLAVVRAHDGAAKDADMSDQHDLIMRQRDLLRGVVNALRGPPPKDALWSVHDAPELAAAMVARAERAEAECGGYSQQTMDAVTREREELRAALDRLRDAVEGALRAARGGQE